MKIRILVASVLGLGVAAGGLAWAGHRGLGPLASTGGHGHFGARFARLHVDMVVERALRVAEATPEQRQKVDAIVEKAFADHARYGDQHRALHGQALEILSADVIDRGRLEELRARHLQIAQQGSRQLVTVLADIAEVLTPEQRQKLAAHAKALHE
jgi:Spy/CpxP family protein refolding chaperone